VDTDKYKIQKNFSKEWVLTRNWMPFFKVFNLYEYKIKQRMVLSLIYEFEIHDKEFDLTTKEISRATRIPEVTVKRHVTALLKRGILTAEKVGRTRKLKLGSKQ
jgi:Fic family protein